MKDYLKTDELHWSATLDKKYPTESQKMTPKVSSRDLSDVDATDA